MLHRVGNRPNPACVVLGKVSFTLVGLAALAIGQPTQAAESAAVPTIDWHAPADTADVAGANLSVAPSDVEVAGDDTFVVDDALPPESDEAMMPGGAMFAGRVVVAAPVLIPVRSALSIGGVMLALLVPVLRHGGLRRTFR